MSIGISCPPGSAEKCNIQGSPDIYSGTIYAKARVTDSQGKVRAEAKYDITEGFVDFTESQLPDGLYMDWLPQYTGGVPPPNEIKEQAKQRFQHSIQVFFCNHAFAHLVLGKLGGGEDVSRTFNVDDIEQTFSFSDEMPSLDDFMRRLQQLTGTAYGMELLKELASPHVALFYGVTHTTAEAFLNHAMKRGLIECGRKTGYNVPYGSGNTKDAMAGIDLTREGLEYKAVSPHTPSCFVVMPFSGLDESYAVIESAWKEVFGDASILRQDKDPDGGSRRLIDEKILSHIESSLVVIADLSLGTREMEAYNDFSSELRARFAPLNPNVMFEVGYAMRCAQEETSNCSEVFLIAQNPAAPFLQGRVFDLRNRTIHSYDPSEDGMRALHATLTDLLQHFKSQHFNGK